MTSIEGDVRQALSAEGIEPSRVVSLPVLPDGSEIRGVVEGLEFVRHVIVMFGDRVGEEEAKLYLRLIFGWLHRRRSSGEDDDVRFVSVYDSNGSVLHQVPVPTDLTESRVILP